MQLQKPRIEGPQPTDTQPQQAAPGGLRDGALDGGELQARRSLREQIARMEREISSVVAERFPFLDPPAPAGPGASAPALQGLAALERTRDALAAKLQELRERERERSEHEARARELLALMKLEPGRHKWRRLPVRDLGEGGCGVWEVRPRLGLIGMLAGWWQVKLSSGCPLARGPRPRRGPVPMLLRRP